jgi:hypothetical protein
MRKIAIIIAALAAYPATYYVMLYTCVDLPWIISRPACIAWEASPWKLP